MVHTVNYSNVMLIHILYTTIYIGLLLNSDGVDYYSSTFNKLITKGFLK